MMENERSRKYPDAFGLRKESARKSVDNDQNTHEFLLDSRNNVTVTIDALRPDNQNDPGNIVRYQYDGISRLVETERVLTEDGTGASPPIQPPDAGTILTAQEWDDMIGLL